MHAGEEAHPILYKGKMKLPEITEWAE